jgi:hypothetical protein
MNATEQSGRKAFLMELDPLYCDVIVQCFELFSGEKDSVYREPGYSDSKRSRYRS